MKKVFLFAAAMMMAVTVSAGKKLIVSVGDFESATSVDVDVEEQVKQNVVSGLSKVGHLQMIEAKDGLGADYLVTGNVLSYNITKTVNDKGEVYYKTTMSYTITAANVKDGTTETETYKYDGDGIVNMKYGYSQDPNASRQKVFAYIEDDMKRFAFEQYKRITLGILLPKLVQRKRQQARRFFRQDFLEPGAPFAKARSRNIQDRDSRTQSLPRRNNIP